MEGPTGKWCMTDLHATGYLPTTNFSAYALFKHIIAYSTVNEAGEVANSFASLNPSCFETILSGSNKRTDLAPTIFEEGSSSQHVDYTPSQSLPTKGQVPQIDESDNETSSLSATLANLQIFFHFLLHVHTVEQNVFFMRQSLTAAAMVLSLCIMKPPLSSSINFLLGRMRKVKVFVNIFRATT